MEIFKYFETYNHLQLGCLFVSKGKVYSAEMLSILTLFWEVWNMCLIPSKTVDFCTIQLLKQKRKEKKKNKKQKKNNRSPTLFYSLISCSNLSIDSSVQGRTLLSWKLHKHKTCTATRARTWWEFEIQYFSTSESSQNVNCNWKCFLPKRFCNLASSEV